MMASIKTSWSTHGHSQSFGTDTEATSVTTKGASHGGSGGIVSYSPLLLLLEYISLGVEVIINPQ